MMRQSRHIPQCNTQHLSTPSSYHFGTAVVRQSLGLSEHAFPSTIIPIGLDGKIRCVRYVIRSVAVDVCYEIGRLLSSTTMPNFTYSLRKELHLKI